MASLRKKPNSRYYYACFALPGGKQVQRSTKSTDRRVAQKLADKFEEVARIRMTEAQARKVIMDIYREVSGGEIDSLSVRAFMNRWTRAKAGTVSRNTQVAYEAIAREFCEFLGERADGPLLYLTKSDIAGFRDQVAAKLTASTANTKLKMLRVALQQAWRDGLLDDNPAAKIPVLKDAGQSTARRAFTLQELRQILAHADEEWEGLILFGLYTGQRLGDLVR